MWSAAVTTEFLRVARARRLPRSFYNRPTLEVARDILGKVIVYRTSRMALASRIVEVEAYIGPDDPACHAARGRTERTEVMFGPPGHAYIYFIYGMYYCLNVVTERRGYPAAVLVRAAEPIGDWQLARRPATVSPHTLLSGPGKICRAYGLTKTQNGLDLTGERLYIEDRGLAPRKIAQTERIGIRQARDRLWRFVDSDSLSLSRPV